MQTYHVIIRPHPWRRLKTKAVNAATRWMLSVGCGEGLEATVLPLFLITATTELQAINGTALNKWLKRPLVIAACSFRHSMRDGLRAVNCPSEMIDQIGGWSEVGGEGYGEGYSIVQKV